MGRALFVAGFGPDGANATIWMFEVFALPNLLSETVEGSWNLFQLFIRTYLVD